MDTKPNEPVIVFDDVHKAFGSKQVLGGMSFEVRRGGTLALMGGSGTGKSVTLRHIIGLMQPDAGRVLVDGHDMAQITRNELNELRTRMGYVFQEGALINWLTVNENLSLPLVENTDLPAEAIEEKVRKTLSMVRLDPDEDGAKLPASISGGMKKRVGLARALITEPEIILYDEPNAGLDPKTAREINLLIRDLADELSVTSLVVEHRIACVRSVADEVIFLKHGTARPALPTEEFFASDDPDLVDFLGEDHD